MAEEKIKKSFSETRAYPIVFMVMVTVIFVGILSTFYHFTIDQVNAYRQMKLQESILKIFELPTQNVQAEFSRYISSKETAEINYYIASRDSVILGYCLPIRGKGLWGTIDALLGLSPDLQKILKLEIIDQNETPGLGGRITEDWFKDQFQNKIIINNGIIQTFQLVPEEEKTSAEQINQITGATASSKSVVDMISNNLEAYLPLVGER